MVMKFNFHLINKTNLFWCLWFLLLGNIVGGCAMSSELKLKWEWPDGRTADQKLIIAVESLGNYSSGLFGFIKSPSIVENVPDPMEIKGKVVGGSPSMINHEVVLVLPKIELGSIQENNLIAVGLIDNSTCICIKLASSVDEDLKDWNCTSE